MNMDRIYLKIAVWCMTAFTFQACTDKENPEVSGPGDGKTVKVRLASFPAEGAFAPDHDGNLTKTGAYLFENGVLEKVWENLSPAEEGYELQIGRFSGHLYVVAGEEGLVLDKNPEAGSLTEEEWLETTVGARDGLAVHYASGCLDLSGLDGKPQPVTMTLKRGVARFDLRTDSSVAVSGFVLKNVAFRGYCFPRTSAGVPDTVERGDVPVRFDTAWSGEKAGVAYVYEQQSPELAVSLDITVDGEPRHLESRLPEIIRRNTVYTVSVHRDGASVRLDVEGWGEENSDLHVPLDGTLRVSSDTALPEGVSLSDDRTMLALPHLATDFMFAVDCDSELELVSQDGDYPLSVEPVRQEGTNLFRIRKPLYVPGQPAGKVSLLFHRKGLENTYAEDRLTLSVSPNPTTVSGLLAFDRDSHACDFARYIDNELGVLTLPSGKELAVEFDAGEDPWIKLDKKEDGNVWRVVAGWKPNDPTADGRVQAARLVVRNSSDGSAREEYVVKRRNYGLPVTWFHGVWWCKYNARGNSRVFADQILSSADPAVMEGKSVFDYLSTCTAESFFDLWKWAYQGDSGNGLQVVDDGGKAVLDRFDAQSSVHINKLPADALSPEGYELPSMEEFNRVFDATDYIVVSWNGTHTLVNPWNGHATVKRQRAFRNDISVGTVDLGDVISIAMWSPDYPEHEPIVWYGVSAQWNAEGILHAGHYNNILFGVYSPEGSGWYVQGSLGGGLYMVKNGAGTKDTRVLRFKKSPVEYVYGDS